MEKSISDLNQMIKIKQERNKKGKLLLTKIRKIISKSKEYKCSFVEREETDSLLDLINA